MGRHDDPDRRDTNPLHGLFRDMEPAHGNWDADEPRRRPIWPVIAYLIAAAGIGGLGFWTGAGTTDPSPAPSAVVRMLTASPEPGPTVTKVVRRTATPAPSPTVVRTAVVSGPTVIVTRTSPGPTATRTATRVACFSVPDDGGEPAETACPDLSD